MSEKPLSTGSGASSHPNPYQDVSSWWAAFFKGGFSWRWFGGPHLYFRPNLEYADSTPFFVTDGLGREKVYNQPFECYIDPFTGKIEKLYVQAPSSICLLGSVDPNCTWKRTPIRNVTPFLLRVGNLPFRFIPAERRGHRSKFTFEDWCIVIGMWIPSVAIFLMSWTVYDPSGPVEGKDPTKYLPLMYRGLKYPRLARNMLENRHQVAQLLYRYTSWNTTAALSSYRTFRPRFLNYLVQTELPDGRKLFSFETRPVPDNDITPFIMIAWSSAHYELKSRDNESGLPRNNEGDLDALLSVGVKASVKYFGLEPEKQDLRQHPKAFWCSANCMPPTKMVDHLGRVVNVDGEEKELLANQDVSSILPVIVISDIIRTAQHVAVVVGNLQRPWVPNALRVWGERVWTLPEIVLSKGETVTVWHCGTRPSMKPYEFTKIPKALFPTYAWADALNSRQLIEHYGNLHLSRLELVKIALECLMSRHFRAMHPGDRVYVLMGLLRIRPPIDSTDTSFQAFARLSLPQDSDRLMERLICLLPDFPGQNWELMTDQYKASLWDVYPNTQICAIGENDTVVIDDAKGAQIQWSEFTRVRTLRKLTAKREFFIYFLVWSPLVFFIGVILAALFQPPPPMPNSMYYYPAPTNPAYQAGLAITIITLLFFILPAPYFLWHIYSGKLWEVEPCFFGIEGYVPIEAIEEKLFGTRGSHARLQWSTWGSPLSRHTQGRVTRERSVKFKYQDAIDPGTGIQNAVPVLSLDGNIDTYHVESTDPTSPCSHCSSNASGGRYCSYHPTVASCQDMSRSKMGQMKVFTLVDTYNMTVTLFYAVRPPTVLVLGGSEGGMKRAIACSFDITTGTLYRETVLRIPSQSADRMEGLGRLRLGLVRPFLDNDVRKTLSSQPVQQQQSSTVFQEQATPTSVHVPIVHEPKI
ncbi:uncharacterized protein PODANS_6_50 [Podospora anserina S mat+]|uniref:Podospora anserina S mat+ genomic DNA chromosome 6, supercontig 2 n=1 Tax=Podospora anserina (strain S / ATCC MYA-4624 / DSM 980 / FGSC 10383) TaxID=515849 RepID=B2B3G8_PODAN|nr:uncharacterized protein PODANS_6_50 [Podospora anserina S mat+]CAP71654.1 unnamed protein product [Podospora anserina S mat+]CDP31047.1 Putative protein of unknown function [Podospora anserina S mat+]